MTDTNLPEFPDFDAMTSADFENYLPDFFASGDGHVSDDPRLTKFLARNPDCAALVRDLETIAETARSLFDFEPTDEPSDQVWTGIREKMNAEADAMKPKHLAEPE